MVTPCGTSVVGTSVMVTCGGRRLQTVMCFAFALLMVASAPPRPSRIVIKTEFGEIMMTLQHAAAPRTVEHVTKLIRLKAYDDKASFYRSDFVLQGGLHPAKCPIERLDVNEAGTEAALTNGRGTAALGHWDKPDNGCSEFFINLEVTPHLDTVYGGYAVFANVTDADSFLVLNAIAEAVDAKLKKTIRILEIALRFDAAFSVDRVPKDAFLDANRDAKRDEL